VRIFTLIIIIIITLFKVSGLSSWVTHWGDCKLNQLKSYQNFPTLLFGERDYLSNRRNISQRRVENQQNQPTYSFNLDTATLVEGKCSHHWANHPPTLLRSMIWLRAKDVTLSPQHTQFIWNETIGISLSFHRILESILKDF